MEKDAFEKALKIAAEEFPNSVISEMLLDFSVDFVVKFVSIYSGQTFHVPRVETVWAAYRNKVIKEALDLSNDRETRDRLATHFGIPKSRIYNIYYREKERHKQLEKKTRDQKMENSLHSTYNRNVRKLISDLKGLLKR